MTTALAWAALSIAWPETPVHMHVRWKAGITDAERAALERQFQLTMPVPIEGTSWEYQLVDASTANIRALIQHERVDDTAHLNRIRFRPELAQDRARQILLYAALAGAVGSLLALVVIAGSRRMAIRFPSAREYLADFRSALPAAADVAATAPAVSRRAAVVTAGGVLVAAAMAWFADAAFWSAAAGLLVVYAGGYVVGSLLLPRADTASWTVIRTVTGLLLSAIAFLLCLRLSIPWFVGPIVLVVAAARLRRRTAFACPLAPIRIGWDGIAAGILAALLLAPVAITFFYMAPGSFPPVFYNVDTTAFLEKVHGLVVFDTYPPESLSNAGVRRTYHYGTQAMAALIARSAGLLPHHALFLVVLPLLVGGIVAAAVAVSRYVSPALPRSAAVPLLLISTPSLYTSFWQTFGARLREAATSGFSIDRIVGDYALWGFLSNEGQNLGGQFVTLGAIAAIAAAPSVGWALSAVLIGSAIVIKTPAGIALISAFVLAEAWRALAAKRPWPSARMLGAVAVFTATAAAFFVTSSASNFRLEPFPLFHVREMVGSGHLGGFVLDFVWLMLPALIVLTAGIKDPGSHSAPILWMAIGPLIVVNATRLEYTTVGGGGTGRDWLQILHTVPVLLHAFTLSLASRRWHRLGRARRLAVLLTMALAIAPVTVAAARYSLLLLRTPEGGHEFVDNRPLAEALAVIPARGSVIVTNDLRYPAQNFTRDDRQLQIPAIFGHQAFAVNYAYEPVEERRPLQKLLQQPEWTASIDDAARAHGWTHLLIRKDYAHPATIPLERIFENEFYAVYRFA